MGQLIRLRIINMGYAQTITVVYGIEITYAEAKKIAESKVSKEYIAAHFKVFDAKVSPDETIMSAMSDGGYPFTGEIDDRNLPVMLSDGVETSVQDGYCELGHRHVLGVLLAERGGRADDVIEDYLTPSKMAKNNWEKYAKLLLKDGGVELGQRKPRVLLVSQIR